MLYLSSQASTLLHFQTVDSAEDKEIEDIFASCCIALALNIQILNRPDSRVVLPCMLCYPMLGRSFY